MTKKLVTLKPEDTLDIVAQHFVTNNLHYLPVIDESGKILGIISKTDFLALTDGLVSFRREKDQKTDLLFLQSLTAAEIMEKPLIKLGPDDTVSFADGILKNHLCQVLPVVDAADKLLGMVSPIDLVSGT